MRREPLTAKEKLRAFDPQKLSNPAEYAYAIAQKSGADTSKYEEIRKISERPLPPPAESKYTIDLHKWAAEFRDYLLAPLTGYLTPLLDDENQPGYKALHHLFDKYIARKEELPNHRDSTIEFSLTNAQGLLPELSVASVVVWQVHKHDDQKRRDIVDSIRQIAKMSILRSMKVCPSYPRYIGAVRTTYIPEYLLKMAKKEFTSTDGTEFFYVITTHTGVSYERTFKEIELAWGLNQDNGGTAQPFMEPLREWYASVMLQTTHAVLCACLYSGLIFVPNENNRVKIAELEPSRGVFLRFPQRLGDDETLPLFGKADFWITSDKIHGPFRSYFTLQSRAVVSTAEWIDLKIYMSLSDERRRSYRPITAAMFDMVMSLIPPGTIPGWLLDPAPNAIRDMFLENELLSNQLPGGRELYPENVFKRVYRTTGVTDWDFWTRESEIDQVLHYVHAMWLRSVEWEKQIAENKEYAKTQWGLGGIAYELDFIFKEMYRYLFIDIAQLSPYQYYYDQSKGKHMRELYSYPENHVLQSNKQLK